MTLDGVAHDSGRSYTLGMKTAVSIPDDVFADAERLAKRLRTSRSKLYARALAEYISRHSGDQVTSRLNEAVDRVGEDDNGFVSRATRQTMRRSRW